ncbi:MAG: cobalamin-dependent protein, partial [Nanoarchaeota archaeon]
MNITLINPRLRYWSPTVVPPLGLTYVASALDRYNTVKIVDMNASKISDKRLEEIGKESHIVGITGMITEYNEVKRIASLVKQYGHNIVVAGGALATTFPNELARLTQIDYVVVGEG